MSLTVKQCLDFFPLLLPQRHLSEHVIGEMLKAKIWLAQSAIDLFFFFFFLANLWCECLLHCVFATHEHTRTHVLWAVYSTVNFSHAITARWEKNFTTVFNGLPAHAPNYVYFCFTVVWHVIPCSAEWLWVCKPNKWWKKNSYGDISTG